MKMNNILKTTALLLGSSVLLSGCIKETFPESGYATSDQTAESPFAKEGLITAMPTVLITNYIDLGEQIDFGYPGIFGATDRMVGEVFPVSGNLPGGNQYYDRWQAWLYPGNSTGLAANGKMSPFFYTNYYKFIFTANEAIDIANQSEGAEEMMGIAKTFRALCYLDLARLYDALPAKAPERPAYETELEAVKKVQSIFRGMNLIPCTACRYCTDGCPRQIAIPDLFAVMNTKQIYHDWNADFYYNNVYTGAGRRASDCIQCGRCEKACPQHLPIRRLLTEIAAEFDKQ